MQLKGKSSVWQFPKTWTEAQEQAKPIVNYPPVVIFCLDIMLKLLSVVLKNVHNPFFTLLFHFLCGANLVQKYGGKIIEA